MKYLHRYFYQPIKELHTDLFHRVIIILFFINANAFTVQLHIFLKVILYTELHCQSCHLQSF